MHILIAPNISISDNPNWGDYNHEIVHEIIKSIDANFSSALELPTFSSCHCYIEYWEEGPMCSKIHNEHLICLSAKEDYWCQWIYQFSHEYCHHLINGTLTGEIKGLMWFEETICHLSSMYHLHILSLQWESLIAGRPHWVQVLQKHQNALLLKTPQLLSATQHPGYLRTWLPILEQQSYHRDYYNALAAKMYPLFVENPHLWKIILHFGDMRQRDSLEVLFQHLERHATVDYVYSLKKLRLLLFS